MTRTTEDLQISAAFFDRVTSGYSPATLFDELDGRSRMPSRIADSLTNRIFGEIGGEFNTTGSDMNLKNLLHHGLKGTREVVHGSLKTQKEPMSEQEAFELVQEPQSIRTLAALSLRHEDFGELSFELPDMYFVSQNEDGNRVIALSPRYRPDAKGGCPFAGKNGEVHYGAAFAKFAVFAGDVAVRSYYHHYGNR